MRTHIERARTEKPPSSSLEPSSPSCHRPSDDRVLGKNICGAVSTEPHAVLEGAHLHHQERVVAGSGEEALEDVVNKLEEVSRLVLDLAAGLRLGEDRLLNLVLVDGLALSLGLVLELLPALCHVSLLLLLALGLVLLSLLVGPDDRVLVVQHAAEQLERGRLEEERFGLAVDREPEEQVRDASHVLVARPLCVAFEVQHERRQDALICEALLELVKVKIALRVRDSPAVITTVVHGEPVASLLACSPLPPLLAVVLAPHCKLLVVLEVLLEHLKEDVGHVDDRVEVSVSSRQWLTSFAQQERLTVWIGSCSLRQS